MATFTAIYVNAEDKTYASTMVFKDIAADDVALKVAKAFETTLTIVDIVYRNEGQTDGIMIYVRGHK